MFTITLEAVTVDVVGITRGTHISTFWSWGVVSCTFKALSKTDKNIQAMRVYADMFTSYCSIGLTR